MSKDQPEDPMAAGRAEARISLHTLGPFELVVDGAPADLPASKKTRALLAFLALSPRPQRRERLCEIFWELPDDPKGSLRWSLSKIRKALKSAGDERLVADRSAVKIDTELMSIDWVDLAAAGAHGFEDITTDQLETFTARIRGGFLEDLSLPRCPDFEAWRTAEAAALEVLVGRLLEQLCIRLGSEPQRALRHAARLRSLAPPEPHLDALIEELKRSPPSRSNSPAAELYRLRHKGPTEGVTSIAKRKRLQVPDQPSIAVLPFDNMSGDPAQEYFADGITDDLITALSKVQSFFVIARNSTFVYKGRAVSAKSIGEELGVRYLMQGSVRRAGDRLRVVAQLAEADTGRQIWADQYDSRVEDIFDLQDAITASVVGAIEPRLQEVEARRVEMSRREDPQAYDLVLRGLDLMNRLTPADTESALRCFRHASEIDPRNGRALICASWCYRRGVQLRGMILPESERQEAIRLARTALNVSGSDPYVLWQAGLTAALVEQDIDAGQLLIDQSLELNANANRAWIAGGMVRCMTGEPENAIQHAERAMRLSPLDTSMWVAHGVLANACMQLGRFEEAVDWARRSVRRHIFNAPALHVLAASCARLGLIEQAREAVDRARELDPEISLSRLQEIFAVSRYKDLDGFLEALRSAGLPDHSPVR